MNPVHDPLEPVPLSRREALQRVALIMGAAISPSLLAAMADGAAAAVAPAGRPRHLSAEQFATVAAIAERILPRTDTPGAREAGVPEFIDLMFGRYLGETERESLRAGLAALEADGPRGFAQLPADRQDDRLRQLAASTAPRESGFFRQMRELTLLGYFTSELVGKNVLHFDPIPGRYDGCVPLTEVGNIAWTVK